MTDQSQPVGRNSFDRTVLGEPKDGVLQLFHAEIDAFGVLRKMLFRVDFVESDDVREMILGRSCWFGGSR